MQCIKFCGEIMLINESITFWVENRGKEYSAPYCVNMSVLEKQNLMGEPNIDSIIRSEGFVTFEEANERMNEIWNLLKT